MKNKNLQYIKIKREIAQDLINLIERKFKTKSLLNKKYKVLKENDYIFFPIEEGMANKKEFSELVNNELEIEIVEKKGIINKNYKYRTLLEVLRGKLPVDLLESIPKSFDIIGNIAIVELDIFNQFENKIELKENIANSILKVNKNVKSVYEKVGKIKGTYRLRKLNFIKGIKVTETIHKENNCLFNLDVKKTFFSPRLLYERKRISSDNIKSGEKIVDLFAGVGPFSIQIAKDNNVIIHSFDINPHTIKYLKENIRLNRLKGNIIPHVMDVKFLLNPSSPIGKSLNHKIDRVLMNLPEDSIKYIDVACFLIKENGGIIHNYQFCEKENSIQTAINHLKQELEKFQMQLSINQAKIVKAYSPKGDMIVIDAFIKKSNIN